MPKKKKIKDNYIVRTKKRILRETADSEAKYKTTFKDIRTYFKIFNKSLFKNELNPFNDVKIKRIVRGSGQCVEYISY
ncbi:SprT-like family protein, partial [Candidatus Pelagibacter sp.]|nr:SprT-like family protein [Candidatus Pelagibacter sp.]